MNTETNTEIESAAVVLPEGPLLAPTSYVQLEESSGITATVVSHRQDVNHKGTPFVRLTFQMENGRTAHDMFLSAASIAYTARDIKKAFGIDIEAAAQEVDADGNPKDAFEGIDGMKCSLSTKLDDFGPNPRVKIRYINRHNPHAGEKVDLKAIFAAAAAAAPPTVALEDVAF